eukprot:TRINITY_DN3295_c0_g2_i2.p1 TRINITY_DN3295_c0_g2~~TRINITY_DN3295_c0_g2_i2.p1  ORF type:complete len:103 (-),score=23.56 TRINITY_DN3295_c0_g2_i2:97-405(-)
MGFKGTVSYSLNFLNLNPTTLIGVFLAVVFLFLLLVLVLTLGVSTFSVGGGFAASVSSILSLGTGVAVDKQSEKSEEYKLEEETVMRIVSMTKKAITSKDIF